jgi:hypothetical protein
MLSLRRGPGCLDGITLIRGKAVGNLCAPNSAEFPFTSCAWGNAGTPSVYSISVLELFSSMFFRRQKRIFLSPADRVGRQSASTGALLPLRADIKIPVMFLPAERTGTVVLHGVRYLHNTA